MRNSRAVTTAGEKGPESHARRQEMFHCPEETLGKKVGILMARGLGF